MAEMPGNAIKDLQVKDKWNASWIFPKTSEHYLIACVDGPVESGQLETSQIV